MAVFQTENLWISQAAEGVATLFLDVAHRPINVLSRQILTELEQALAHLEADASLKVLHIRSGKEGNFIAGADISEFANIKNAAEAVGLSEKGQAVFARLASLPIPTVAVIGGACLGGGLELALSCDYRVVVDDGRAQLGLPEVELGLVPGWGGTQRLPRVVGLERGLQMILSGRRLRGREAVQLGLADALYAANDPDHPPLPGPLVKRPISQLPRRGWRRLLFEGTAPGRWLVFRATERILRQRVPDDMPAPWEALQAVRIGLAQGLEAGLAYEREAIGRLAVSPACRNLVTVFFRQQEARKLPEPTPGEPRIHKVGVVGAGTMGAGIAQLAALRKCEVVVQEVDESALGLGMLRIIALFNQAAQRGLLTSAELTQRMGAIHGSTSWKRFDDLDLVIEAVVEDLELKIQISQIEEHVGPDTIIATNTSSLRVQDLQEGLKQPERVAGLHFFNPVHKMPLLEVVCAPATREQVAAALMRFGITLGKTPVLVKDSPGFLVNRVLMPYLNETLVLISEGLSITVIDQAMRSFGMPVGPLELLDQIGLDVAAHIAQAMAPFFGDRLQPHPGFESMVSKGWLGDKSGVGFYRKRHLRKKPNPLAENVLRQQAGPQRETPSRRLSSVSQRALVQERLVGLMVNEAAACLGEKVVADAATLDLALILGVGWAPHRGGPMTYARNRGFADIVASLTRLAADYGERFEPCAALRQLAGQEVS